MIKRILSRYPVSRLLQQANRPVPRLFSTETVEQVEDEIPPYEMKLIYTMNHDFEKSVNNALFSATCLTIGSAVLFMNTMFLPACVMGAVASKSYAHYNLLRKTLINSIGEIFYDGEQKYVLLKLANSQLEFTKPIDEIYFSSFYKNKFGNAVFDVHMTEGSFHVFYFPDKSYVNQKMLAEMVQTTEQPEKFEEEQ